MQYRVSTEGTVLDLVVIHRALHAIDPAGVADFEPAGGALRISTWASETEVAELVSTAAQAGTVRVERVASECCGGCGG